MFEQGTPGPSANSNMIERLTNLSSKGAEPQRPIEGLRRHLRIDLVLHAAMRDVRFGSDASIRDVRRMSALPPASDVSGTCQHFSRGPIAEVARKQFTDLRCV